MWESWSDYIILSNAISWCVGEVGYHATLSRWSSRVRAPYVPQYRLPNRWTVGTPVKVKWILRTPRIGLNPISIFYGLVAQRQSIGLLNQGSRYRNSPRPQIYLSIFANWWEIRRWSHKMTSTVALCEVANENRSNNRGEVQSEERYSSSKFLWEWPDER